MPALPARIVHTHSQIAICRPDINYFRCSTDFALSACDEVFDVGDRSRQSAGEVAVAVGRYDNVVFNPHAYPAVLLECGPDGGDELLAFGRPRQVVERVGAYVNSRL